MSLLTSQNLKFGYLDECLFSDGAFKIESGDRVGLIGANGSGKTTLFKLITGEYSPWEGGIVRSKELKIGYMEQYLEAADNKTLYDEVLTIFDDVAKMEIELEGVNKKLLFDNDIALIERQLYLNEEIERREGLVYKAKTRSALLGLGFSENDLTLPFSSLSGGQRSKAALCKLLLSDSQLLLLDEPTNNLDIDSVLWLEDFLLKYKGAFIVVSHDRYFLDKVTAATIEIAHKKLNFIKGSYSEYFKIKAERELFIEREYEKNLAEIKRIEGIIEQQKRFNQARNYVTIASKQKQIERLKAQLIAPETALKTVHFSFDSELRAGDEVLIADSLSKGFTNKHLFSDFSITVRRGERVFLLGPNGCGKSTFLKILNREISQDSGIFRYGVNVKKAYFAQNVDNINSSKTVLDDVWDMYRNMTETEVRNALAMFLFCGDDVFKTVTSLSGGEKAKLSLLKIMLSKPNFLILDEPTNHLDISSREVLESALAGFSGTLLIVSHDRYFINKLSTRVVYLSKDGAVNIDGNYDDYLRFLENEACDIKEVQVTRIGDKPKVNDYKLKKEQASNERKRQTRLKRLEEEIAVKEERLSELQALLSLPETASDYQKLLETTGELNSLKSLLDSDYVLWEELSAE